jgi:uncharacterized protein (DUF934 family)
MKPGRADSWVPPRVLTRDGVFTDDDWPVLAAEAAADAEADDAEPVLLPLGAYLAQAQPAAHGVWLAPTDEPGALDPHLASVPLIAVLFPKFADGRGYSIAARLRRRGYRGDLRAIGEVLIDQLFMLKRVGFTSFALRADQSADDARAALQRHSDAYQAAYDIDLPAYRRGRG